VNEAGLPEKETVLQKSQNRAVGIETGYRLDN
jgi:hypothetical protein